MKNYTSIFIMSLLVMLISTYAMATDGDDKDDPKSKKEEKETKKTMAQPDVPGALVIEITNNILSKAPDQMKLDQWGSWTVNLYYLYELPIGKSNFSLNAGFGVGLEKYSFIKDVTLATIADDTRTFIQPLDNLIPDATNIKKSVFATNYVDIPMEIRFHADKENPRKSFKVAVGGKFGIRYDVHTKVKYEENEVTKKFKTYEKYNVPNFRYGVYGRIGLAGVGLYYYYSLTEMFDNKKGPDETRASVMMVGLSLSGF